MGTPASATGRSPAYFYYFKHKPPFPRDSIYANWGASHYAELWYMFDHLNQESWNWSAADRKLAEQMSSYWTTFAKSGDPNRADLPPWPAFAGAEGKVLHIGDPITVDGVANLERLRIFDAAYDGVRAHHSQYRRKETSVHRARERRACNEKIRVRRRLLHVARHLRAQLREHAARLRAERTRD